MQGTSTGLDRRRGGRTLAASWLAAALLAACGGGGGGDGEATAGATAAGCSLDEHKGWLGTTIGNDYFWYQQSPKPLSSAFGTVDAYFDALLYTGSDPRFPADRWSNFEASASFDRFFGEGATLGYGISVAGLELDRDGSKPLVVRYVEAASPAAAQGVQRGDRVLQINGRSAESIVAADDYAALTAANAGDTLTLVLRRGGTERTLSLSAAVFSLTPVTQTQVLTSQRGRKVGYVHIKDMISQALAPMEAAFATFKAQGVQDLVLDLRYNGGGLVSTGATLGSYIAGARGAGLNYATLLFNDKRASSNQNFAFSQPAAGLGLPRVVVLMGRRTCSASEQVINGLRGAGIEVVTVGEASCGKPVGFVPVQKCGRTYSVVNFESVNQRNEGRYFDGFTAACPVAEDVTVALGDPNESLLAKALLYADLRRCENVATGVEGSADATARALSASRGGMRGRVLDERQGMLGR